MGGSPADLGQSLNSTPVMAVIPRARRSAIAIAYGFVCHAAFAVAVGTMMVAMYSGTSVGFGTLRSPWNWFGNTILVLQFQLLHSFLLTARGRAVMSRLAPRQHGDDLSTTTYVIIASAQVMLLFALWSPTGIVLWEAKGLARALLSVAYAAAWLLLLKSIMDAGLALHTGLLGWSAVRKGVKPQYPPMPSSGLFRLCRQPIYVSFALTLWTVPDWTPDQLFLATSLTIYCIIGPLFKERRFKRFYGAKFDAYRRRVPYWLPWPRPRAGLMQKPSTPMRNDQSMYRTYAAEWWTGRHRWLRTMHNLVPPRLKYFDRIVKDWRGMSVLDLGCGGGFMAESLAERGARVIGIDPSGPAIEAAREHAEAARLHIDYRVACGERLPCADESLDCVVVVDVLEHVADPALVLDEVRRVLKPSGLVLFDTLNRTMLAAFAFVFLGEVVMRIGPRGTHDPRKFIKPVELRAMLLRKGFDVGPMAGLGPSGLNRRFDITFAHLPTMSLMYMGYAVKMDAGETYSQPRTA
jgi:ubiquinone biosynthesis O-methyltransferase